MKEILLATGNSHKVVEISEILSPLGIKVLSLKDFPDLPSPEETGETFTENALIKARAAHFATGLPVLADDSGLVIESLGGEPGVHSARYAGPGAPASAMIEKVLKGLKGLEGNRRQAHFETVLIFQYESDVFVEVRGVVQGHIALAPCGEDGFGYDPIFIPKGETRSFAEMSLEEKNEISHRSRALAALLPKLREILERRK